MRGLTLRLFLVSVDALGNQNFVEPVICHLQYKAPVDHTVPRFEPSMADVAMVQVLQSLITVFGTLVSDKNVMKLERKLRSFELVSPTRIRSINREDLNIQSRRTSSLLSNSSKLPLLQCSVTTPKIPQSKNRPRNRLIFSCLMSLSWWEDVQTQRL